MASFESEDRGPRTYFLIWNLLAMSIGAVAVREYRNARIPARNQQSWATWAALVSSVSLILLFLFYSFLLLALLTSRYYEEHQIHLAILYTSK